MSLAGVETHREFIESWPRAHGYRFGFHLGEVLSLRTQRDWGKAWQKGNGQRFASGMQKMSQRTPQVSPAKNCSDDQDGEWTTEWTLSEDCGAVLSPIWSQQLAPGRPWNSQPPVAQVLRTRAGKLAWALWYPRCRDQVRIKWHLRCQGHWKGQKEQIGGAGVIWTMVSLTVQVKS